jgi:hypothetical protein
VHEPITEFPPGRVIGSVRLAKGPQVTDVTRLRYGSRTRFVERVTQKNKHGTVQTALRKTDDFPSDKIANRFISEWLAGIVENREFKIVVQDPDFASYEEPRQPSL